MDITDAVQKRLSRIRPVVEATGTRILSMQNGALDISHKANQRDLVTAADLESERLIIEEIMKAFPSDQILAEESGRGGAKSEAPFVWLIDPVDGTVNYAHGIPLFSISIGIMHRGRAVGGLVAVPALGDLYIAIETGGAFKNGKPIHVSGTEKFQSAIVATGFPYDREGVLDSLIAGVRAVLSEAQGIRRTGSAALDLCWVAEGRLDAYYEVGLKPWDTCAGTVIAKEAGAVLTDLLGAAFDPFQSASLAASNQRFHDELLNILVPVRGAIRK